MTVAAMMTAATTTGVRDRSADGEEADDTVIAMMMVMAMTVGMTMEMGRGKERQIEQGVRMRMRKCLRSRRTLPREGRDKVVKTASG
jgi:hypothetical protein